MPEVPLGCWPVQVMNQHPFFCHRCALLLAFTGIMETEIQRLKERKKRKVERRINQSHCKKKIWQQIKIFTKELQNNEHALKAKGRRGRTADGELW